MVRLLPSKGSGPLSHVEPSFIDAHLVRESSLKGFLPVVLELLEIVLGATPCVAHPAKPVREELSDVGDPVVVEPVHHPLDHLPGLLLPQHRKKTYLNYGLLIIL